MKRREALRMGLMALGGTIISSQALAQAASCGLTPVQAKGPFYPIKDQADKNTDLTQVGTGQLAEGKIIWVQGIVTDQHCRPVPGALVEIWQACHSGKYDHPSDPNTAKLDPNFQYWGKAIANPKGEYKFKTILPGAYPADVGWMRPPHIHFKIQKLGYIELITQMYFAGDALNDQDLILKRIPKNERPKVVIPLQNIAGESHPVANFNISLEKI